MKKQQKQSANKRIASKLKANDACPNDPLEAGLLGAALVVVLLAIGTALVMFF